ncbi:MAG TPA: TadE/TadG family type IV pilus assembly protein [Caulobacteraceae bacterium]|nr:TadE/TadG family type IV pilus assembly protein [Caulobacteraceae bacterium]
MQRHDSHGPSARSRLRAAARRGHGLLRRLVGARRGNVAIMFALMAPVLFALVGGGIDLSYGEDAKVQLQDATDAAALAVSAEVVKNPNDTEATLKTLAQNSLTANYTMQGAVSAPTITNFHVCAPVQNDCNNNGVTMANDTVAMNTTATAPCIPIPVPTTYCTGGSQPVQTVTGATTAVIGFGATLQLNIVMDISASMIVGATSADVTDITNWMSATTTLTEKCGSPLKKQTCVHWGNWNSVMSSSNQVADYPQKGGSPSFPNDNPPCAFSCHDDGTATGVAVGETNAHAAGATTRFDVMIAAANQLISNIQSLLASNANLAKNTYLVNLYGFDDSIHTYGSHNMTCTAAACSAVTSAIASVAPGVDTYLNSAMQTFSASSGTNAIGANGTGASASSPLKFMILVTDGLQSDRGSNWSSLTPCSYSPAVGNDPNWNYNPTYFCGFDGPINQQYCTALKNEGVVLAVLETPYVPLDGSDPQVQPYEKTVRHTIFPGGSGSASTISAALQSCATTGYYFQANSPSDISTGFTNLTTKFIQQHSYLSK